VDHLAFASIARLSSLIEGGQADPVALTEMFLARAQGAGKRLNAYVSLRERAVLAEAQEARDRARQRRRLGPLDGIPIALKDNIDIVGAPTTNGMGGVPRIAEHDSIVARRLKHAGALVLGKLNMHEGALGGTTDNPHYGRTHNPFRMGYSPGGSSGGSAAAVAAGLCAAALGTDTAGSIRLPASYCGVVGFKPTYQRVGMQGIVPLSRRLDHVGPLTRTIEDAAVMMGVLTDSYPAWMPPEPLPSLTGRTVCVLDNFGREAVTPEITRSFAAALGLMANLGARIVYTDLAAFDPATVRQAMFLLAEAGAAVEHGAVLEREPERFSTGFARCVRYGSRLSVAELRAVEDRIAPAATQMLACFDMADVIASPTTPQAAFRFDQDGLTNLNTFCTLANFTGCPAVSLPMGLGPDGLPHGLHLIGALGRDEHVLAIAQTFEAAAGLRLVPPAPFGPQT
jgi:Asp-tRNA(Asn)/Glu-tRNA(Gln) amidotransferase A subunit family amidase